MIKGDLKAGLTIISLKETCGSDLMASCSTRISSISSLTSGVPRNLRYEKQYQYSISINNIKNRAMVFFVKSFPQKWTSRKKNHTYHSKALVASSGLFFSNSRYLGDSGQNGKVIN